MSVTPERAQSADFTDSYIDDEVVMAVKKDSKYANATKLNHAERYYGLTVNSARRVDKIGSKKGGEMRCLGLFCALSHFPGFVRLLLTLKLLG